MSGEIECILLGDDSLVLGDLAEVHTAKTAERAKEGQGLGSLVFYFFVW